MLISSGLILSGWHPLWCESSWHNSLVGTEQNIYRGVAALYIHRYVPLTVRHRACSCHCSRQEGNPAQWVSHHC